MEEQNLTAVEHQRCEVYKAKYLVLNKHTNIKDKHTNIKYKDGGTKYTYEYNMEEQNLPSVKRLYTINNKQTDKQNKTKTTHLCMLRGILRSRVLRVLKGTQYDSC